MSASCVHGKPCFYANADNAYCLMCDNGEFYKPMTNADRIRAMTDEGLAMWFIEVQDDIAHFYNSSQTYAPKLPTIKDSWLDWLKQEAEE